MPPAGDKRVQDVRDPARGAPHLAAGAVAGRDDARPANDDAQDALELPAVFEQVERSDRYERTVPYRRQRFGVGDRNPQTREPARPDSDGDAIDVRLRDMRLLENGLNQG
jgi:hypothetical protein